METMEEEQVEEESLKPELHLNSANWRCLLAMEWRGEEQPTGQSLDLGDLPRTWQENSEGAASEEKEAGTWEPRGRTSGKESMR